MSIPHTKTIVTPDPLADEKRAAAGNERLLTRIVLRSIDAQSQLATEYLDLLIWALSARLDDTDTEFAMAATHALNALRTMHKKADALCEHMIDTAVDADAEAIPAARRRTQNQRALGYVPQLREHLQGLVSVIRSGMDLVGDSDLVAEYLGNTTILIGDAMLDLDGIESALRVDDDEPVALVPTEAAAE